jgi:tetratricopeptide (TPR) repeat protein
MTSRLFVFFFITFFTALPTEAKLLPSVALSNDLLAQARLAQLAGKQAEALDLYETAALANPANPAAYVGMARAFEALGMQGKALRYYREALELNPNDVGVLESQTLLMIAKGNLVKADAGFARMKKLCAKTACPAVARVDAALAKARTQTSMATRMAPTRVTSMRPPVAAAKPAVKPATLPAAKPVPKK